MSKWTILIMAMAIVLLLPVLGIAQTPYNFRGNGRLNKQVQPQRQQKSAIDGYISNILRSSPTLKPHIVYDTPYTLERRGNRWEIKRGYGIRPRVILVPKY